MTAVLTMVVLAPAGAAPRLGASDPIVEWDQSGFASRPVGTRSEPHTVRLTNEGVLPLELGDVRLDGPAPAAYSVVTDCPGAVLLPGAACEAQVIFAPLRAGVSDALLHFTHDGPSREAAVPLAGVGTLGVYLAGAFGEVVALGDARLYGDLSHVDLGTPVLGIATTPTGLGYWLVQADGLVHAFGDAARLESPSLPSQRFVTAIASTPSGGGYWLAADDGSVHAFGDAGFFGSAAGTIGPDNYVVDISATPSGAGYWLLDIFGGIHAFGDAGFFGAPAELPPLYAITALAPTSTGKGYWVSDESGGIFAYGDAKAAVPFPPETRRGSFDSYDLPVIALEATPTGKGFWSASAHGAVYGQGDADRDYSDGYPVGNGGSHLRDGSFVLDMAIDVWPFTPSPDAGTVRVEGEGGLRLPPSCVLGACA